MTEADIPHHPEEFSHYFLPEGMTIEKLSDAAKRLDEGAAAMAHRGNGIGAANAAVAARRLRTWARSLSSTP